jgi:F-type H+-transporting ATPase subunit epsilon
VRCKLVTPDETYYDGPADVVVVPAVDGDIGVWARHTPLLTQLGTGTLKIRAGGELKTFRVEGGFAEVGPDAVVVAARAVVGAAPAE